MSQGSCTEANNHARPKHRCTQATQRNKLSSLKYLLRQGLPIHGHKESEGSLLKLQSNDCPQLKEWLDDNQYLSHDMVNELIILMGNTAAATSSKHTDSSQ